MTDKVLKRGRVLRAVVDAEDWEVLDFILDSIPADCAEDGTPEGFEQGAWIGYHLGFLRPHAAERASYQRLIDRYQVQLDKHRPGTNARELLKL